MLLFAKYLLFVAITAIALGGSRSTLARVAAELVTVRQTFVRAPTAIVTGPRPRRTGGTGGEAGGGRREAGGLGPTATLLLKRDREPPMRRSNRSDDDFDVLADGLTVAASACGPSKMCRRSAIRDRNGHSQQ